MVILILPFRARAVTLGFRMSAAILRVRAVVVLPLDFVGIHLPGALHGAEASLVSISGFEEAQDCLLSGFFVWWSSFG